MKLFAAVIFALLCLCMPARAEADFYTEFDTDSLEGAVPGEARPAVEGISPQNAGNSFEQGILNLLSQAAKLLPGSLGEGLRTALGIVAIAAICAVAGSVTEGVTVQYVQIAGVLGIAALTLTGFNNLMGTGREAISQMNNYSKALLPALAAAGAASGKPAAAILRQAGTAFAADLLITMYDRLLCPLLYAYAALITFNAALPHDMLKRIAGFIKWIAAGLLSLTLFFFTLYITIGGAISGTADAAAVKTAKTALSGFVPVVGGIIADASETLLLGASVVKNAIGVFGMLVVLGTALAPCLALAVRYICVKLSAALTGTVGGEALASYVDGLSGLYSMLLGMVSATAFLLVISVVSCILAGGGA